MLTGATGFLGSAFYLNAFELGYAADCLLLVRGADEVDCRARLARSLARALGPPRAAAAAHACAIVRGDLHSLADRSDPRLDHIERVVHLAADTSFTSGREVWSTNFVGTLALATRARRMPRLSRFLHVGTAFSCGEAPRHALVHEAAPPDDGAPHIVEYTRSKAATEAALATRFADLPIVVARPSIVVGHSQLGCAVSSSIFWYFRVIDRTGLLPCALDDAIDVVTSDWAAQRLHDLAWKPALAHNLYHVAAGASNAARWRDMASAFESAGHAALARTPPSIHAHLTVGARSRPASLERFPNATCSGVPWRWRLASITASSRKQSRSMMRVCAPRDSPKRQRLPPTSHAASNVQAALSSRSSSMTRARSEWPSRTEAHGASAFADWSSRWCCLRADRGLTAAALAKITPDRH